MKICYVTTIPATIQSFILPLAEYLHENTDWDISFICSDDEKFEKSLPEYINFYPVHMERGISVAGVKAMFQIKKILKKEKFDMVQYSTPNASLYSAMAAKLAKIPVRLYCQWGIAYVGFNGLKRKIFKIVEKFVCGLSTCVQPDSKSNLNFARSEGLYSEKKSSVIWNGSACGVSLDKFNVKRKNEYRSYIREKYNIGRDTFVYIFIGRVTRDKGINELLSAFKRLNDDSVLFLLGNNEVDTSVNRELYDWSLENKNIIYTGNVDDVERYLSAADCYVLPSYREGFGMSVIEAEAMGVPVIVTDIPGPVDAVIDNKTGLLVKKADENSLLDAMKKIRKLNYQEMGKEGHKFASDNFEQKQLFDKIIESRNELLKQNINTD
nr:glycosyltransferase family 4 protein [uncultured Ruminococcus sp.]